MDENLRRGGLVCGNQKCTLVPIGGTRVQSTIIVQCYDRGLCCGCQAVRISLSTKS